jgi:hypothetical protein
MTLTPIHGELGRYAHTVQLGEDAPYRRQISIELTLFHEERCRRIAQIEVWTVAGIAREVLPGRNAHVENRPFRFLIKDAGAEENTRCALTEVRQRRLSRIVHLYQVCEW